MGSAVLSEVYGAVDRAVGEACAQTLEAIGVSGDICTEFVFGHLARCFSHPEGLDPASLANRIIARIRKGNPAVVDTACYAAIMPILFKCVGYTVHINLESALKSDGTSNKTYLCVPSSTALASVHTD